MALRAFTIRRVHSPTPIEPEWRRTFRVRMSDGIWLTTDAYVPSVPAGRRVPVVFARVPYGRREMVACLPAIGQALVERGYALVAQDIRGRYESEGDAAPFAEAELRDAYESVEWIARQPWAADCVIALGDSYGGWLAYATSVGGHRLVRALVVGMTSTRIGSDWMYNGDAFCLSPMLDWATVAWSGRDNAFREIDWSVRPLADLARACLGAGAAAQSFADWARHPCGSPYWSSGAFSRVAAGRVRHPTLHLGGWWDLFRTGQLADWRAARARSAGHLLVMSAADHHHLPLARSPWLGSPVEDDAEFADRYVALILPFLDVVSGTARPLQRPPVRYELSGAGWFQTESWPPPDTTRVVLNLVDGAHARADVNGGGLTPRPALVASAVDWVHDPDNLVPALEDDPFALLIRPVDQRPVQDRDDVLTFSTPPLTRPLELVGSSVMRIATTSAAGRQFVAKLTDVYLDGRAFHITSGVANVPAAIDRTEVSVALAPCAYRIEDGHALRLEIAASHFPRYLPAAAADPWLDLGKSTPYDLIVGGSSGSCLELSVRSAG